MEQKKVNYDQELLNKAISRGRSTEEKKQATLSKIIPTENTKDVEGSDLIIEAVFENVDLKDKVTKETETVLAEDKIPILQPSRLVYWPSLQKTSKFHRNSLFLQLTKCR